MEFLNFLKQKLFSNKENLSLPLSGKQILFRQVAVFLGVMFVVALAVISVLKLSAESSGTQSGPTSRSKHDSSPSKINVEIASNALDPDRMWRNHFEDKLQETQQTTNIQLSKIAESINARSEATLSQTKDDIQELKNQIFEAKRQLEEATNEMRDMRLSVQDNKSHFEPYTEADVESFIIDDELSIAPPKDSKFYIPETSYIEGTLLAGIAVSTSVGSISEPVPVIIRITGRGNLPKNFAASLEECRVLGSSYGDISSERAVIRAESLVCVNKSTEEVITTKIAGAIYGDDGMNGLKGKVVDMSTKHVKNAAVGGLLSGFASSMKSEGQLSISNLGAINTKQQGLDGRLRDNAMSGMGNAAEKIADYYIKQAENMSPVLQIPGGTRVDVVFTKGVYLGSSDVVRLLEKDRKKLTDEIRD